MRLLAVMILAVGLGFASAYGFFLWQVTTTREGFYEGQWALTGTEDTERVVRLEVKGPAVIDFGVMQTGRRYERELIIENSGVNAGEIWIEDPPARELRIDIPPRERQRIEPKSTFPIKVACLPEQIRDGFSKIIILQTNQGSRTIPLTVTGKVVGGLRAEPLSLELDRQRLGAGNPLSIFVYSWLEEPLEIGEVSIIDQTQVDWMLWDPGPLPEEQALPAGARHGVRINVVFSDQLPADLTTLILAVRTNARGYERLRIPVFIR